MNKKFTACGIAIIAIFIGILICKGNAVIEMQDRFCKKEQKSSLTFIDFDEETELTFYYDSKVKDGDLAITLKAGDGEVIKAFETNTKGKEKIILDKNKTYIVSVEAECFSGGYYIKAVK
ncbi:MAG: hypothetical protein J6F30_13435 [Cellulosilyticum sp.]|nr:hypothetical protein [Cellulosilyticum sp.]